MRKGLPRTQGRRIRFAGLLTRKVFYNLSRCRARSPLSSGIQSHNICRGSCEIPPRISSLLPCLSACQSLRIGFNTSKSSLNFVYPEVSSKWPAPLIRIGFTPRHLPSSLAFLIGTYGSLSE